MKPIVDTLEVSRSRQQERKKQGGSSRKRYYKKAADGRYFSLIRQITDERATYGYRRVTDMINRHLEHSGQYRVNLSESIVS